MTYFNAQGQGRVGWRSLVVTQVVNAVDADAQAFITAAGITNLTQASAVNVLVNDLKTYGLWTKMKSLYPMVGGSATSHKFNLKDPRDLDAAYRLVFNGGWIHSATGAKPNGTTGYANTGLVPNTVLQTNSTHLSYYSRTNVLEASNEIMAGSGGSSIIDLYVRFTDGNMLSRIYNSTFSSSPVPSSQGFFIMNRPDANTAKQYRNSTLLSTSSLLASTKPTIPLFIGCSNNNGAIYGFSTKESAFASIGDGLTDTEATNFYNSVQKFQTTLGRQIGSPIVSDTDAQAFINAAGLTNGTQASAINTLVDDLKTAGLWTKMKAIYPFVGGTATTHKFNLKDPRDLNAAFRLTSYGGLTHDSNGVLFNGNNSWFDTSMNAFSNLSVNSLHLSFYSRTNIANVYSGGEFGHVGYNSWTTPPQVPGVSLGLNIRNTQSSPNSSFGSGNLSTSYSNTNGFGLTVGSITNSTTLKILRGNVGNTFSVKSTSTGTNTGTLPNYNISLGKREGYGEYSYQQCAFASIGDGLTDAEASTFYTAIQKYQTTLGRQV
jgi:hypothetical protein